MSEIRQQPEPEVDPTFAVGPAESDAMWQAMRDEIIRGLGVPARLVGSLDGVTYSSMPVPYRQFFKEPRP